VTDPTQLEWSPVAILPNIEMEAELGNEFGVLCSENHTYMQPLLNNFPELEDFAGRFSDAFGVQHRPSFVLFNRAFEQRQQNSQAFLAFRNSIAVPLATYGRCLALKNSSSHAYPLWTDSFDCYPWMLGKDLKSLIINSGAFMGFHEVSEFNGQSSAQLPHRFVSDVSSGDLLCTRLLDLWSATFVKKRQIQKHVPIFRSLEMAYEAGRVPFQYAQTDTDHGRLIALWISAFEILAHPGKGNGGLLHVLSLLEAYDAALPKKVRARRYSVKFPKQQKSVDLLEKTYRCLHDLRNDYLHGNPRSFSSLIPKGFSMNHLHAAPALYRMCLFSKLGIATPSYPNLSTAGGLAKAVTASIEYNTIRSLAEEALLAVRHGNDLTNRRVV
jgi:hypothetical protein